MDASAQLVDDRGDELVGLEQQRQRGRHSFEQPDDLFRNAWRVRTGTRMNEHLADSVYVRVRLTVLPAMP